MTDNEETPAETIERLTELNNQLAQMLKRGSDRLQESARELMAQGWDAGLERGQELAAWAIGNRPDAERPSTINPYRQPLEMFGATK